jgi:hypothetical protein
MLLLVIAFPQGLAGFVQDWLERRRSLRGLASQGGAA